MSPLAWAYLWTGLVAVWGLVAFGLAIGLPRGYTGHLLGWVFVGMSALMLALVFLPSH